MSGCLHALSEVVEQVRGLRGRFRPSGHELGGGWDELLRGEPDKPYWSRLLDFVTREHENHEVYPPRARTFRAFE